MPCKEEEVKMMYKENFVVVVKHRGKILRERDGMVTFPFGEEYNLLLKNLESRKAVVKVSIDSEDVLSGNSIIIQPNSSLELKGFMKGTSVRNRFKFIQKTKEIVDYRGDRVDDGIVRVEFKFEKKRVTKIVEEKRYRKYEPWPYWYVRPVCPWCGDLPCSCLRYRQPPCVDDWTRYDINDGTASYYNMSSNVSRDSSLTLGASVKSFNSTPLADEGITVKGSKTRQDFTYGYTDELEEQPSVIIIRLRGTKSNRTVVEKPLTVKTKLECSTCGKRNKSTNKFCHNCGTYLSE